MLASPDSNPGPVVYYLLMLSKLPYIFETWLFLCKNRSNKTYLEGGEYHDD